MDRELPIIGSGGGGESAPELLVVPADYVPRKCGDVLELDMGDGLILYNHDADLVHHMNPTAGIIWQLCDGEASVGQLAFEIADEYGLEHDQVQDQVAGLIGELDALGLVEDSRAPQSPS